jgi:HK97 family phage major capsid protein
MAIELERDASAALAVLLPMVFGQRAALAMSDAAINGGTSNGQTVIGLLSAVAGLPSGNVVTSGSSSSPALIDFQKMLLAMNRAYRRRCAFYMPSSTWLAVSEFLEIAGGARAENQYVGLTGTTLLGRPVYVCDSMAPLTASGIFAVCAVPDLLLQRRVAGGNVIQRIAESSMSDISKGEIALMNVVRWDFYASLDGSNIPPYVAGYLN